jgi:hypothetical protein
MNYPLAKFAEFFEFEGRRVGLLVTCPNCGALGSAYFESPIGGGSMPQWARVKWQRSGDTLEAMSLTPSFLMIGHYHSWIRNGQLCVDSEFSCKENVMAKNGKAVKNAVVDAKCKLAAADCKDPHCPVHGEPEDEKPAEEGEADSPAPYKGDDKVAAAEAEGKAIAANGVEEPIATVDAELLKFVMDHGYSEEAAKSLIAEKGDMIRADFAKKDLGSVEDVLADAADIIKHIPGADHSLLDRIDACEDERQLLIEARAELRKITHHNDFTTELLGRIERFLE